MRDGLMRLKKIIIMYSGLLISLAVVGTNAQGHHGITISPETESSDCGACHKRQFGQWKFGAHSRQSTMIGTSHANASDTVFKNFLTIAPAEYHGLCRGCHTPGDVFSVNDKVNQVPLPRTTLEDEGVNCIACHFNGDEIVRIDSAGSSLFCATCHNDGYKMTSYYDEWTTFYDTSVTCLSCHMKNDHLCRGLYDPSLVENSVNIDNITIPANVVHGVPFGISFDMLNNKVGHAVPSGITRKLRVITTLTDRNGAFAWADTAEHYRRHFLFGEDESLSDGLMPGESRKVDKVCSLQAAGRYNLKIELYILTDRIMSAASESIFVGGTYRIINVM